MAQRPRWQWAVGFNLAKGWVTPSTVDGDEHVVSPVCPHSGAS